MTTFSIRKRGHVPRIGMAREDVKYCPITTQANYSIFRNKKNVMGGKSGDGQIDIQLTGEKCRNQGRTVLFGFIYHDNAASKIKERF